MLDRVIDSGSCSESRCQKLLQFLRTLEWSILAELVVQWKIQRRIVWQKKTPQIKDHSTLNHRCNHRPISGYVQYLVFYKCRKKLYCYVWTIRNIRKILYKRVVWNRRNNENQTTAKTRSNNQQEIHFDLGILVSSFEKTRFHPMMLILHLTATLLHYSMFEVAYLHLWRLDVTSLKP